jgi:hypothetical protein
MRLIRRYDIAHAPPLSVELYELDRRFTCRSVNNFKYAVNIKVVRSDASVSHVVRMAHAGMVAYFANKLQALFEHEYGKETYRSPFPRATANIPTGTRWARQHSPSYHFVIDSEELLDVIIAVYKLSH